MPGPAVLDVPLDPNLPAAVDVVVIGGGIIGAATALELCDRGLSVALCEKGVFGGEQSSRNWGWVRTLRRDPREIPLMVAATDIWADLDERLGGATGYVRSGIGFACQTAEQAAIYERWLRHIESFQTGACMLCPEQVAEHYPGAAQSPHAVLWSPLDGRAEPQRVAPLYALAVRRAGGHVLGQCAVRALDMEGGRVSGVITERGRVRAQAVVLAGGAWSGLFARHHDLRLPQLSVLNSVVRTAPLRGAPEAALWDDRFAFRKRADGGYTIATSDETVMELTPDAVRYARDFWPLYRREWRAVSLRLSRRFFQTPGRYKPWEIEGQSPFERARVLDPAPDKQRCLRTVEALARVFPAFAAAKAEQFWGGYIDVTPDEIPVISAVGSRPGFYVATGFSGHGFGIGPGAGRLMAQLVTGERPLVDPEHFRFERFGRGFRPEFLTDSQIQTPGI